VLPRLLFFARFDQYQGFRGFFDQRQENRCVRKQFLEMFAAFHYLPYLCIVNQKQKLLTG
jgi:hypothetical protein